MTDTGQVRFFDGPQVLLGPAVPQTVEQYLVYRQASDEFIKARNRRIDDWTAGTPD